MFAAQVLGSRVLQVQVRVDDGAGAVVGDGERRVEEVLLERPLPDEREDGVVALVRAQLQDRDDPVVADPFQSGMSGRFLFPSDPFTLLAPQVLVSLAPRQFFSSS